MKNNNFLKKIFHWKIPRSGFGKLVFLSFLSAAIIVGGFFIFQEKAIVFADENVPPTVPDAIEGGAINEGEDRQFNLVATDPDSSPRPLEYFIVDQPAHGEVSIILGTNKAIYKPFPDFYGDDSFTYKVSDGVAESGICTIYIRVNPINDAPVLNFIGNREVNELETLTFTASARDADNDVLIYSLANAPAGASIASATGVFSWTPTEEQGGNPKSYYYWDPPLPRALTVNVSDGHGGADSQPFMITVYEVNVSPTAADMSIATAEDIATTTVFSVSDPDIPANTLIYSIVSAPVHGAASIFSAGRFAYTPELNYNGSDSFTYKANDKIADSNIATVNIAINAVNDAPAAVAIATSTDEEVPIVITFSGTDVEGQVLTFATTTSPGHGTLNLIAGNQVSYTPALDFYGIDSFTYKANDGIADGAPATVTITVNPINDAPTAASSTINAAVDDSFVIALSGSDVDGDTLSYVIVNSTSTFGSFGEISENTVVYTPTGVLGTDTFAFKVNDGIVDSNIATTTINLTHGALSKLKVGASPKKLPTASDSVIKVTGQDKFGNTVTSGYSSSTKVVILSADNGGILNDTILNLKRLDGVATTTLTKISPGRVNVTAVSPSQFVESDTVKVTFTALIVNNIRSTKTYATADNTYENGWQWIFDVTIPAEEYRVKMKFSNWVSGTSTIPVAGNIRFYSPQSSNAFSTSTAKTITLPDDYKGNVDIDTGSVILYFGNDATFAGVQIQLYVEAKIPEDSAGGIYAANFGIKTVPLQ